jgi:hypothetical protein
VCFAQYKVKPAPVALTFVSGAFDGWNQQIQFHYWDFKKTFPNANDKFWDPAISWRNKYEYDNEGNIQGEKFPFSSTALVFLTDGYHLTRTTYKLTGTVGAVWLMGEKKKWYYYIFDALIYSVARGLGFHFTYTVLPGLKN